MLPCRGQFSSIKEVWTERKVEPLGKSWNRKGNRKKKKKDNKMVISCEFSLNWPWNYEETQAFGSSPNNDLCYCWLVAKSCPTLCNPMDYSQPGSSVHEISQARILEWVANALLQGIWSGLPMPSSRGSSPPREQTRISCTAGGFFTTEPLGKANSDLATSYSLQRL